MNDKGQSVDIAKLLQERITELEGQLSNLSDNGSLDFRNRGVKRSIKQLIEFNTHLYTVITRKLPLRNIK